MRLTGNTLLGGVFCLFSAGVVAAQSTPPVRLAYPPTRTDDVVDVLHGVRVPDAYRWLEDGDDPNVQAWTAAQCKLTRQTIDQFAPTRTALRHRLEVLHSATSTSAPTFYGTRYFFAQRKALENHAVLFVRDGDPNAPARELLNPNTFSADGTTALDWWTPSPDGSLIVYGKSEKGSEESTLHVRDVRTGKELGDTIPQTRHAAIAWDADGRGFCYTRYPAAGSVPPGDEKYYRHIFHHALGADWHADPNVYGQGRPKEMWPDLDNSSDDRYQFLTDSIDWTRNDLWLRPMGGKEFTPVASGLDGNFGADVCGDKLLLHTNWQAPRYRVLITDLAHPDQAHWRELIPQQTGVISQMLLVGGKIVLHIEENAYSRLSVYDLDGKQLSEIPLPTLGSIGGLFGRSNRPELFFTFQSWVFPPTNYVYSAQTGALGQREQLAVDADLTQYATEQRWCKSRDGTRVPFFVMYRRGLKMDGNNPAVLYGYGGFADSQSPFLYRGVFPWLDAGGVFAVVCARGGGEFGKEWHLAGRAANKQHTFDDFIAAGEQLVADGFTRPERLGLRGGSNGGLSVGAVLTQRPDLFRAVVCEVPLLDMLRYQRREIARLWIPEYGDPDRDEDFNWLMTWSPYQHVKPGTAYPAVFFTAGEQDARVDPMHARKMCAALQAASTSNRPVLLWVNMEGGHGVGAPLRIYLDEQADFWTFLMWQLGVPVTAASAPSGNAPVTSAPPGSATGGAPAGSAPARTP